MSEFEKKVRGMLKERAERLGRTGRAVHADLSGRYLDKEEYAQRVEDDDEFALSEVRASVEASYPEQRLDDLESRTMSLAAKDRLFESLVQAYEQGRSKTLLLDYLDENPRLALPMSVDDAADIVEWLRLRRGIETQLPSEADLERLQRKAIEASHSSAAFEPPSNDHSAER